MGLDMYLSAKRYLWNKTDDVIAEKVGEEGLDRVLALPDEYSFHYQSSW